MTVVASLAGVVIAGPHPGRTRPRSPSSPDGRMFVSITGRRFGILRVTGQLSAVGVSGEYFLSL